MGMLEVSVSVFAIVWMKARLRIHAVFNTEASRRPQKRFSVKDNAGWQRYIRCLRSLSAHA